MSARDHPIERAMERYGLILTVADVHALESQIACRKAVLVRHEKRGATVWLVEYGQIALVAVYGPGVYDKTQRIITFLPVEGIMSSRHKAWRDMPTKEKRRLLRERG